MKKKLLFWCFSVILIFLFPALVKLSTPSLRKIKKERELKVGYITNKSNTVIEVHIMVGDVFNPKRTKNDLGFDLVPISLYFDPISLPTGEKLVLINPLLRSALSYSIRDTNELIYFLINILNALEESRKVVACYMKGSLNRPCEGDQITPYIWVAYEGSIMNSQGVKYLAALPLFDPLIIANRYPPSETRRRLRENLEAGVRRLVALCGEKLEYTVGSIAFAALGGTSRRGDSQYFLQFDESFLTILNALESSYSSPILNRVYFVAFEKHTGRFQQDALKALAKVSEYVAIKKLLNFKSWGPLFTIFIL